MSRFINYSLSNIHYFSSNIRQNKCRLEIFAYPILTLKVMLFEISLSQQNRHRRERTHPACYVA